jgi:arylsulfatase A-like enzyme
MGHHYYPRHLWSNQDSVVLEENAGKSKGIYGPTLIHDKTLQFIDQHKDHPFFLYVASIIPHAELIAPENVMKKHRGKYLPETAYQGIDDGKDYRKGPYESQEETHTAFVSMINILDDQIGEIMQKLDSLGIAQNTLVIFTSDNGPHEEGGADPEYFDSNGPLKGVKRDLYEGGIRVPMIASWPGKIRAGSQTDHISAFWDVFPTLGDIADFEIPENLDGISFAPTLFNLPEAQKEHEYLYWEFHEKGGRQAIRMDNWKAVRYGVFDNPNGIPELYDLSNDISEEHDIADQHPDIIIAMENIFKKARTPSTVFTFGDETYLNQN